jgi:hypothetical protein
MSIGANTPPNRSLEVHHDSGATNDVTPVLRLSTRTGGTPLAGIGTGLEFLAETGIGNDEVLGAIHTVTTDVNPSTEDADMVFSLMAAGAAYTEKMRIKSTGEVTLSALTKAGGALRDAVVTLTDAASVALDALLGDTFYLGANGDRTIATPTNKPGSGFIQRITIRHEALGANRTLSLTTGSAGAFRFGTFVTALTATLSGTVDYIGAIYNHLDDRWDVVSYSKGF